MLWYHYKLLIIQVLSYLTNDTDVISLISYSWLQHNIAAWNISNMLTFYVLIQSNNILQTEPNHIAGMLSTSICSTSDAYHAHTHTHIHIHTNTHTHTRQYTRSSYKSYRLCAICWDSVSIGPSPSVWSLLPWHCCCRPTSFLLSTAPVEATETHAHRHTHTRRPCVVWPSTLMYILGKSIRRICWESRPLCVYVSQALGSEHKQVACAGKPSATWR